LKFFKIHLLYCIVKEMLRVDLLGSFFHQSPSVPQELLKNTSAKLTGQTQWNFTRRCFTVKLSSPFQNKFHKSIYKCEEFKVLFFLHSCCYELFHIDIIHVQSVLGCRLL